MPAIARDAKPRLRPEAVLYMVRENVAWKIIGDEVAFTQQETVPVCDQCVTPNELKFSSWGHEDTNCKGCGLQMKLLAYRGKRGPWVPAVTTCSDRCLQRACRVRRRASRAMARCEVCKGKFQPKRADARYCSNACRHWTYRLRMP